MPRVYLSGKKIDISDSKFVKQGGQARVYAIPPEAYKVYHDPAMSLPPKKVAELSVLTDPRIVRPQSILTNKAGTPVGYTMLYVDDPVMLASFIPKGYREQNHLPYDVAISTADQLYEIVVHVHERGLLIVDMNEKNFLLGKDHRILHAIDVDNYQTPSYPAEFIQESIRDPLVHGRDWTQLSDWFSFACLAFQIYCGASPYSGKYRGPKPGLLLKLSLDKPDDGFCVTRRRMQQHVSLFNKDVATPAGASYPLDVIPAEYKGWLRQVLEEGKRLPPPRAQAGRTAVAVLIPAPLAIAVSLDIRCLCTLDGHPLDVAMYHGKMVVLTKKSVWLDHKILCQAPEDSKKVLCSASGEIYVIARNVLLSGTGSSTVSYTGAIGEKIVKSPAQPSRFHTKIGCQILEIQLPLESVNHALIPSARRVANVLEYATQTYTGCFIQDILGNKHLMISPEPGIDLQFRVKELDSIDVLAAKYDNGVFVALCHVSDGAGGKRYDRAILRLDLHPETWHSPKYDVQVDQDVGGTALPNFAVLSSGVCALLDENNDLHLFDRRPGHPGLKKIKDPALTSDMRLFADDRQLFFFHGSGIYSLKTK